MSPSTARQSFAKRAFVDRVHFIEVAGWNYLDDFPLRITRDEWENILDVDYGAKQEDIAHPLFTLRQDVVWAGAWDYCEVLGAATRRRHRRFGPFKRQTLARDQCLAFLVAEGVITLIASQQPPQARIEPARSFTLLERHGATRRDGGGE